MSASFLSAAASRTRQTHARYVQSRCGVHVLLPRTNPAASDGLRTLIQATPLKDGPAVLIQVCSLHLDRALERMTALHGAGAPIFVEKCPKGEASTCLFRCCDLSRLLDSVLRDIPLPRADPVAVYRLGLQPFGCRGGSRVCVGMRDRSSRRWEGEAQRSHLLASYSSRRSPPLARSLKSCDHRRDAHLPRGQMLRSRLLLRQ